METKICTGECGLELPATAEYFSKSNRYKSGLLNQCKNCINKRVRKNWNKNKDIYNKKRKYRYHTDIEYKQKKLEYDRTRGHILKNNVSEEEWKAHLEKQKKYRKNASEEVKNNIRKGWNLWKEKHKEQELLRGKKYRDELHNGYVKYCIIHSLGMSNFSKVSFPNEIIELKRAQLKLHRETKKQVS